MAIAAIIPVANRAAANQTLGDAGWGFDNFSVPLWADSNGPEYAGCHFGGNVEAPLLTIIKALPGVVFSEIEGSGRDRFRACLAAVGCQWGTDFPVLPDTGIAAVGLYQHNADDLSTTYWRVIQQIDRDTFSGPPETLAPAIIRRLRVPGQVAPWVQPIDQFDAYKLVNPFTGRPDEAERGGKYWRVDQADGAGNNVSVPGEFGWVEIDGPGGEVVVPAEPEVAAWVQPTGTGDAYAIGDEVTHANAQDGGAVWLFRSKIAGNTTEPGTDGTFHRWWEPVSAV